MGFRNNLEETILFTKIFGGETSRAVRLVSHVEKTCEHDLEYLHVKPGLNTIQLMYIYI